MRGYWGRADGHCAYLKLWGVIVEFDHSELDHLTRVLNTGGAGAAAIATALTGMGVTAPAAIILGIVGAVVTLGANLLTGCDNGNGIFLYIVWAPIIWWRAK